MIVEAEKASRAARIGEETGLFSVPRILDFDRYAFIAAGAVVREDVPDFALVAGVPAKRIGWMSKHGDRLEFDQAGRATCLATGEEYVLENGVCREADAG